MADNQKIAIYSGVIPSTTFIERLIAGLSGSGSTLYLFGVKEKSMPYNDKVKVLGYRNAKIPKLIYLIKYSLLLLLFRRKDKRALDQLLKKQLRNGLLQKVKTYPVLWHRPDVFHVQWAKGLDDWMWVKQFGIKLVLSLRGAHINYSPLADPTLAAMYRKNFPVVDAFHAVSKAIAKEAARYGAPEHKIQVVYSGMNLQPEKQSNTAKNDGFQIISVGRPHWIKGYTYALDACHLLKLRQINFHYTIIGGQNDIELAYQIRDLGLEAHVTLCDTMPFTDVKSAIQRSDLLLLPSVEEGLANVVLEAMALNTLVLTTACGGMDEVVRDGDNGFMVPIRNPWAMAEKIMDIADISDAQKENILTKARDTVENHHHMNQMLDGMRSLYQKIITVL